MSDTLERDNATVKEAMPPKLVIPFGKFQGRLLTRVEAEYLQWLANRPGTFERDGLDWIALARQELDRRGTNYDGIMPSNHALDRFSTRRLNLFLEREDKKQGIASFLSALAVDAWENGHVTGRDEDTIKKAHKGAQFVYALNQEGKPIGLKTVL